MNFQLTLLVELESGNIDKGKTHMRIKIFDEKSILNKEVRVKIINEIIDNENKCRKKESLKKHEVYNGNSKKWVIQALADEGLREDTIQRMANRASNIAIMRKVTNKIAKCYSGGCERIVEDETSQQAVNKLSNLMNVNTLMDTSDKYSHFDKNCVLAVMPKLCSYDDSGRPKFKPAIKAMPAYSFDVVENSLNPTEAKVVILTDFVERDEIRNLYLLPGQDGHELQRAGVVNITNIEGDGVDQIIADNPADKGKEHRTFIWWSDKFHFTTDVRGDVIPPIMPQDNDGLNPIGILPFVTIAEGQTDSYWVMGGEQLIDGDILTNKMITDRNMIAYVQGWGQLVIAGKDLPDVLQGGPDKAFLFNKKSNDDSDVQVFYASANPDLASWDRSIEQHLGLYLSTNNLSTRNVASKLDVSNSASGIAMLIEQSESLDDIKIKQRMFQDNEPILWEIIKRWQNLYFDLDLLDEEFMEVGKFEDSRVYLKFFAQRPVITEGEQVEILTKRKTLGIDTIEDLIKRDNPEISDEELEKKLAKLLEERKLYPDFYSSQRFGYQSQSRNNNISQNNDNQNQNEDNNNQNQNLNNEEDSNNGNES